MLATNVTEQRCAVTEHHWVHSKPQFVYQSRVEQAGNCRRTARHVDLATGLLP
jgi:hypothetical protein